MFGSKMCVCLCVQLAKAKNCCFLFDWSHLNTHIHTLLDGYLSQELVVFSIALLAQPSATFLISTHLAHKSSSTIVICWSYVFFQVTILWCRHRRLLQDNAILYPYWHATTASTLLYHQSPLSLHIRNTEKTSRLKTIQNLLSA